MDTPKLPHLRRSLSFKQRQIYEDVETQGCEVLEDHLTNPYLPDDVSKRFSRTRSRSLSVSRTRPVLPNKSRVSVCQDNDMSGCSPQLNIVNEESMNTSSPIFPFFTNISPYSPIYNRVRYDPVKASSPIDISHSHSSPYSSLQFQSRVSSLQEDDRLESSELREMEESTEDFWRKYQREGRRKEKTNVSQFIRRAFSSGRFKNRDARKTSLGSSVSSSPISSLSSREHSVSISDHSSWKKIYMMFICGEVYVVKPLIVIILGDLNQTHFQCNFKVSQ